MILHIKIIKKEKKKRKRASFGMSKREKTWEEREIKKEKFLGEKRKKKKRKEKEEVEMRVGFSIITATVIIIRLNPNH